MAPAERPTALQLKAVRYERNPPDPSGTAAVFRRVGYAIDEALADLIDNSLDAGARHVLIRFIRREDRLQQIAVVDDGSGIPEGDLSRAMKYGAQREHAPTDLGKYGIGLKSASFSQCKSVTLVTRYRRGASARRWTIKSIEQDWRMEVIDRDAAARLLDSDWGDLDLARSGTIVLWDELDAPALSGHSAEDALSSYLRTIPVGLGLRFHRLLASGQLEVRLDVMDADTGEVGAEITVPPLDPFGYQKSGRRGFPLDFRVSLPTIGDLKLRAHIWPPLTKDPNYKLGGGRVAERQGFYFYRNGRLIQAGGWNGLRGDSEPHLALARVEIDLPPSMDGAFNLSIQKSRIIPPPSFAGAVEDAVSGRTTFADYLAAAQEVYRKKDHEAGPTTVIVPGTGIPAGVTRRAQKSLASNGESQRPVAFRWVPLEDSMIFEIDREADEILLNSHFRSTLTAGAASAADAPIIKMLLFLLLRDEFARQRLSTARKEWLQECNQLLHAVVRRS